MYQRSPVVQTIAFPQIKNMKAIVAAAKSQEEAEKISHSICCGNFAVLWIDINAQYQVTVIVESEQEFTERLEKEFQASDAVKPTVKKQSKALTVKDLNAKAEKLCLFNLAVQKNQGQYEIINNYGKNERLYSCKTAIGISRQLTKIYDDKQIASLQSEGLLPIEKHLKQNYQAPAKLSEFTFEVGETYVCRCAGDAVIKVAFTVIKKSASFLTLSTGKRCKIYKANDTEFCYPEGKHSNCLVLKARSQPTVQKPIAELVCDEN